MPSDCDVKKIFPLFLLLSSPVPSIAGEKLDHLSTSEGKVYLAVTVRKVEPDGLSIFHQTGSAKVSFESLSPELRTQYGYNETAAIEYRKRVTEIQRARDIAERAASEKWKKAVAAHSAGKADAEFARKLQGAARMIRVDACLECQRQSGQLVGEICETSPGSNIGRSRLGGARGLRRIPRKEPGYGVLISATARVATGIDDSGAPCGLPPIEEVFLAWEGKAWRIGTTQYTTCDGDVRTGPLYTASEQVAADYYRRHGF
jgi:hypothetical protein